MSIALPRELSISIARIPDVALVEVRIYDATFDRHAIRRFADPLDLGELGRALGRGLYTMLVHGDRQGPVRAPAGDAP